MRRLRRRPVPLRHRVGATLGVLALVCNILAPAAFAAVGAHADEAMFLTPFPGAICHAGGGNGSDTKAPRPGPDCPLCRLPAAFALGAASPVPLPVAVRWVETVAPAAAAAPPRAVAPVSAHRPRAPPVLS